MIVTEMGISDELRAGFLRKKVTGKVILTNVIKGTPFNESRKTSCRCLSTENAEKCLKYWFSDVSCTSKP